jgi:drug/metabolite transporter (DMT)-like permease
MESSARRLPQLAGAAMLVLATALWGSNVVVTKYIVADIPPGAISLARFAIAAIAMLPFVRLRPQPRHVSSLSPSPGNPGEGRGGGGESVGQASPHPNPPPEYQGRGEEARLWRHAFILAVLLLAGYGTQTVALRYTTANRAAFITAMNVIFVPIFASIFGRRVSGIIWAAAITALIGCGLLCGEGGGPNIGDLWSLGTAITWGSYIYRYESVSAMFPPLPLAAAQFIPMTVMSAVWTFGAGEHVVAFHWPWLLYLGLGATAATTLLQTAGQRVVPAPQTAVIFVMEPVFAAICSYIFLGERLMIHGIIGALLIIIAAIISQMPALLADRSNQRSSLTPEPTR